MYSGPTRGGARGGRSEFSWEQVKNDEHRENYLGHSVLAPVGRWQKGRDINWYNKEEVSEDTATAAKDEDAKREARRKELLAIKQREEEEINRRLGRKGGALPSSSSGPVLGDALVRGSAATSSGSARGTGANTAPLDSSLRRQRGWGAESKGRGSTSQQENVEQTQALEAGLSKEELKAARKLARREVRERRHEEHRRRKEERLAERAREGGSRSGEGRHRDDYNRRDRRTYSRSQSRSRSRSPQRSYERKGADSYREHSHRTRRDWRSPEAYRKTRDRTDPRDETRDHDSLRHSDRSMERR